MEHLPPFIGTAFGLTTALAVGIFYQAAHHRRRLLGLLLVWLLLQGALGWSGWYTVTDTLPPRFLMLMAPSLLVVFGLLATARGRTFLDGLSLKYLTLLHIVRIPVEVVLFWLYLHQAVPQLMTFEGRNLDILSGLSAPVVYFFWVKQKNRRLLILWNWAGLALLLNIVVNAVLSAPSPIQLFAFGQPNVAVLYFPFVWLPSCVVPLVLLAHVAAIRQLRPQRVAAPATGLASAN
jgi:hypothetical protein